AQYFHTDWDYLKGDPETIILAPVEQAVKEVVFNSPEYTNIDEHILSVIIPTAYAASFRLDGAPVSFTPIPSNPAFSFAVRKVAAGKHALRADGAFNAVVYGTIQDRSRYQILEVYSFALGAHQ